MLVKSADLPLHYFDLLFRRFGALLLFALWAVRAAASYAAPAALLRKRNTVAAALLAYLLQAALRMGIYQLHVAGGCKNREADGHGHPPAVRGRWAWSEGRWVCVAWLPAARGRWVHLQGGTGRQGEVVVELEADGSAYHEDLGLCSLAATCV